MNTRTCRLGLLLSLVGVAAALGVGSSGAARADGQVASGTWKLVNHTQTLIKTVGGDQYFSVVESPAYVGGLIGTAVDTYILIVHSDGSLEGAGNEVCNGCAIGGRMGNFTAVFRFSASATGAQRSRFVISGGSGGLAGIEGTGGTFTATAPGAGTYAYGYEFDHHGRDRGHR